MKNHDEDVNVSSLLTEHHKKEKFRDSRRDLKLVKMRDTLRRHTCKSQVRPSKWKMIYIFQPFSKSIKCNDTQNIVPSELHLQECL